MECLRITEINKPLVHEKSQIPIPSDGEVLVRVEACAVCYRDILDRKGAYPFVSLPVTSGHEFAGVITKVGPKLKEHWKIGDRVANTHYGVCNECTHCQKDDPLECENKTHMYGLLTDGGYAQYVICAETSLVKVPDSIPFAQASFLYCTAAVAYRGLKFHGNIVSGQRVLITGATGGVGIHAVQIVKALGATAIAVTSSKEKEQALRNHGADEVIVGLERFEKKVSEPVDLVLELTGKPTFASAIRCLKPKGKMVIIGNVLNEQILVNPGFLILKELSICGSRGATRKDLEAVFKMVEEGKLQPVVAGTVSLKDAEKAQQMLLDKSVTGRIVLLPNKETETDIKQVPLKSKL